MTWSISKFTIHMINFKTFGVLHLHVVALEFSLQILGILLNFNLGDFAFHVSFSKRANQMFAENIGWREIAVGDLRIHHAVSRNEHTKKRNLEKRIVEEFRQKVFKNISFF